MALESVVLLPHLSGTPHESNCVMAQAVLDNLGLLSLAVSSTTSWWLAGAHFVVTDFSLRWLLLVGYIDMQIIDS